LVTGFPPYGTPSREDERFEIISQGGLVNQLQAWESVFAIGVDVCCISFAVDIPNLHLRLRSCLYYSSSL
jgi:hypothetical protein